VIAHYCPEPLEFGRHPKGKPYSPTEPNAEVLFDSFGCQIVHNRGKSFLEQLKRLIFDEFWDLSEINWCTHWRAENFRQEDIITE